MEERIDSRTETPKTRVNKKKNANEALVITVQSFCVGRSLRLQKRRFSGAENYLTLYIQLSFLIYTTVALTVT